MFELRAAETQMVQPSVAPARPMSRAPSSPPPPQASAGGLGGMLRSMLGGLRRPKPMSQPAAAPPATHTAAARRPASAAPPPAPPPPPIAAAPAATPSSMGSPVESPAAPAAAEPSEEWISRDIVGGAAGSHEHTEARHATRAKPPMHDTDDGLLGAEPQDGGAEPAPTGQEPSGDPSEKSSDDESEEASVDDSAEPPEARYLNAKLAGREADAPLDLTTSYVLEVSVDLREGCRRGRHAVARLEAPVRQAREDHHADHSGHQRRLRHRPGRPAAQASTSRAVEGKGALRHHAEARRAVLAHGERAQGRQLRHAARHHLFGRGCARGTGERGAAGPADHRRIEDDAARARPDDQTVGRQVDTSAVSADRRIRVSCCR